MVQRVVVEHIVWLRSRRASWLAIICCFSFLGMYANVERTAVAFTTKERLRYFATSSLDYVSSLQLNGLEDDYITTDQEVVLDPRDRDFDGEDAWPDDKELALYNQSREFIRVALYVGKGTTSNAKRNIPFVLRRCSNRTVKVCFILYYHE